MAGIKRWTGSAWEDVADIKRWTGSAWETINQVNRWSGSAWEKIWPSYTVTVSGESVTHDTDVTATAGIRFNSDGTVDKREGSSYTQVDTSTDWIDPNGAADSTYDVRITSVVWTNGSSFFVEAASEDVWIDLGSDREWSVQDTQSSGLGRKTVSFTVEIRKDEGAVIDSATYSLDANYQA